MVKNIAVHKWLWLSCLLLLSSCSNLTDNCSQASIIKLRTNIPIGAIDLTTGETVTAKRITVWGFYLKPNLVVMPLHGVLPSDSRILKIDKSNDLAWLKMPACAQPLPLAPVRAKNLSLLQVCGQDKTATITALNQEIIAANWHGAPVKISGLIKVDGNWSMGDSGLPLCNQKKQVVGILTAIDEEFAYLKPSTKLLIPAA